MRKYWRQFEELATVLKTDPLLRARIKLGILFFAFVLSVFFIANEILDRTEENATQNAVFFVMASAILLLGYFLTSASLRPIRDILRAQKRFIADASHELRTPLSIMKTNSEIALMDGPELGNSESIKVITSNIEEIDRMSRIIENLLSLSYYENKIAEIQFMPVNLGDLVYRLVEKTKNLAAKKSIPIEIDRKLVLVEANETAMEQMVINLLKNAITYTPPGGVIKVSVKNKNGNGILRVADTGIGIDSKDLPHVFEPFYKSSEIKEYNKGSSGLGLTIVKKIIERHQGTININSELGKGTVICVCLPASS